jgi:hypothetical protein
MQNIISFKKFLKVHSLQKDAESAFLLRLLPANYMIFEVPVFVYLLRRSYSP